MAFITHGYDSIFFYFFFFFLIFFGGGGAEAPFLSRTTLYQTSLANLNIFVEELKGVHNIDLW